MKKRKIVIFILAAVLLLGLAGYGIWQYQLPRFHDVTVELGSGPVSLEHFLTIHGRKNRASFVTDIQQVDWGTTGNTQVTLRHGLKEEVVHIHIQDTTAPKVEFREKWTVGIGQQSAAEDFVISAEDLSGTTVSFLKPPVASGDYQDVIVTVVVTDGAGNAVQKECVLSYSWMRPQVTLELGDTITKDQILLDSRKDEHLINQADLDAINQGGVGEYTITSTSGATTQTCVVTVRDTIGPELTLKQGQIYQGDEAEVQLLVEHAVDLSGEVTLRFETTPDTANLGMQTVTVVAEDVYGNATKAEVQLEVIADTTAPSINFSGPLTVGKNSNPDYLKDVSAYDIHDGVCEVQVDTTGVDLSTPGTYKVVYTAKDQAGNTAQKKREVIVSPDKEDTQALVKQIAATLSDDPLEIRNFVREIQYTHNWGGEDPAWFGFTRGHGNCYVHALCLKALLEEKGYETQLIWVEGSTPGSEVAANGWGPHYWLIIKLDGQWKHIDATPGPTHTIYDEPMNDTQRLETLKGRTWDTSRWPACP